MCWATYVYINVYALCIMVKLACMSSTGFWHPVAYLKHSITKKRSLVVSSYDSWPDQHPVILYSELVPLVADSGLSLLQLCFLNLRVPMLHLCDSILHKLHAEYPISIQTVIYPPIVSGPTANTHTTPCPTTTCHQLQGVLGRRCKGSLLISLASIR